MGRRILLCTLGSLGDIYPMLGLAGAFADAGWSPLVCSSPAYAALARKTGLDFTPLGRDENVLSDEVRRQITDEALGSTRFIDAAIFGQLEEITQQLWNASRGAEAIISTFFVVPAHLVAERRGVPYFPCSVSPCYFLADEADRRRMRAPAGDMPVAWNGVLSRLRRALGLPRRLFPERDLYLAGETMLGLFPPFFVDPAAPLFRPVEVTGYPQRLAAADAPSALPEWTRDGGFAVFSFGSYVSVEVERYLAVSTAACRALGLKCLYLVDQPGVPRDGWAPAEDVFVHPHVNHDAVMPQAEIIIHHGGTGTLLAACRAAKPMIVTPFAFDQPYNARRLRDLGLAELLAPDAYEGEGLLEAMRRTLGAGAASRDAIAAEAADNGGPRVVACVEQVLRMREAPADAPVAGS